MAPSLAGQEGFFFFLSTVFYLSLRDAARNLDRDILLLALFGDLWVRSSLFSPNDALRKACRARLWCGRVFVPPVCLFFLAAHCPYPSDKVVAPADQENRSSVRGQYSCIFHPFVLILFTLLIFPNDVTRESCFVWNKVIPRLHSRRFPLYSANTRPAPLGRHSGIWEPDGAASGHSLCLPPSRTPELPLPEPFEQSWGFTVLNYIFPFDPVILPPPPLAMFAA